MLCQCWRAVAAIDGETAMKDDVVILLDVFVVWAALATVYALVPMFDMPAAARVWGAGSIAFLALGPWLSRLNRNQRELKRSGIERSRSRGRSDGSVV